MRNYIDYYQLVYPVGITNKKSKVKNKSMNWLFYNVFRNAKSIQIQPLIAILINIRQMTKKKSGLV